MPRGPRITFDQAIFHIINRGNARQTVFKDNDDYWIFLKILARYKDIFKFKMYHFILMPNHLHLLWEINQAEDLSRAMQGIALSYTHYHHFKYRTVGYLWQGRFRSMIIDKDNYLMACGGYIERNAVRANLVSDPKDWPWSSYRVYAFGEPLRVQCWKENKFVDLVDINPSYEEMGKDVFEREKNYQESILSMDDKVWKEKLRFQDEGVLGSEDFRRKIEKILGFRMRRDRVGRPLGGERVG